MSCYTYNTTSAFKEFAEINCICPLGLKLKLGLIKNLGFDCESFVLEKVLM
jgi:hypothetical protein